MVACFSKMDYDQEGMKLTHFFHAAKYDPPSVKETQDSQI